MNMGNLSVFLILIILLIPISSASDLMGFSSDVNDNNGNPISSGNIFIEIWDSSSGGKLVYNSTDDFIGNISNGKVDINLGDANLQQLNLEYGKRYYMEVYINNEDLDFDSNERQIFYSSVGNITSSYISPSNITDYLLDLNSVTLADFTNDVDFVSSSQVNNTPLTQFINDAPFLNSSQLNLSYLLIGENITSSFDLSAYLIGNSTNIINFTHIDLPTFERVWNVSFMDLASIDEYVNISGDTMTGDLISSNNNWSTTFVGIGTTNPTHALNVNSNSAQLNISNLTSTNLEVDLDGTVKIRGNGVISRCTRNQQSTSSSTSSTFECPSGTTAFGLGGECGGANMVYLDYTSPTTGRVICSSAVTPVVHVMCCSSG